MLHIAGPTDYEEVRDVYAKIPMLKQHVAAFCHRMDLAYRAADLAIARSGASSMAELAYFGVPSLLVPYPHAAEDARTLAKIGILDIIETDQGEALSITCAQLVRIWGDMRKAGFDQRLDYRPDILGFYTEAADFVGRWEASTFMERVDGHIDVAEAATMVEHALPLMLDFFGLMRQRAFFRYVEAIRAGKETDRPAGKVMPSSAQP